LLLTQSKAAKQRRGEEEEEEKDLFKAEAVNEVEERGRKQERMQTRREQTRREDGDRLRPRPVQST
jgi:hypothetical protein